MKTQSTADDNTASVPITRNSTGGNTASAPANSFQYDDIINLPHHRSNVHPPLGEDERAAQFSPFAALSGYDEIIEETAILHSQNKR